LETLEGEAHTWVIERADAGDIRRIGEALLQLDGAAGLLDLRLELVGLLAVDPLLDRLRGLVDERLGLLQAEARRGADDLDHLDLLVAGAGQDHVDRGLALVLAGAVGPWGPGGGRRPRGDGGRRPALL